MALALFAAPPRPALRSGRVGQQWAYATHSPRNLRSHNQHGYGSESGSTPQMEPPPLATAISATAGGAEVAEYTAARRRMIKMRWYPVQLSMYLHEEKIRE